MVRRAKLCAIYNEGRFASGALLEGTHRRNAQKERKYGLHE
jgi:hypothetical protein